jgi:hypothetical protein
MRFKTAMAIMSILMVFQLFGDIKVTGELLIPTAGGGEKSYKGVLTITRALISIECDKKIFQPFNEFEAPKQKRLNINASEVVWIEINGKEKKIYLRVEDPFVSNYRNIFHLEVRSVGFSFDTGHVFKEFWAIIFSYEKLDMKPPDEQVVNSINKQSMPLFTKHFIYSTKM